MDTMHTKPLCPDPIAPRCTWCETAPSKAASATIARVVAPASASPWHTGVPAAHTSEEPGRTLLVVMRCGNLRAAEGITGHDE
jgi:hypothetical protein